ncbi:MAG: hypothetical protein C5B52_13955 [Bacteroidetes bacterium]|nr:MAG: hypothetical protein C5B52_13955 [Bacteroidota bacterium]
MKASVLEIGASCVTGLMAESWVGWVTELSMTSFLDGEQEQITGRINTHKQGNQHWRTNIF